MIANITIEDQNAVDTRILSTREIPVGCGISRSWLISVDVMSGKRLGVDIGTWNDEADSIKELSRGSTFIEDEVEVDVVKSFTCASLVGGVKALI
jgi:hypothetical protein